MDKLLKQYLVENVYYIGCKCVEYSRKNVNEIPRGSIVYIGIEIYNSLLVTDREELLLTCELKMCDKETLKKYSTKYTTPCFYRNGALFITDIRLNFYGAYYRMYYKTQDNG